MNMSNTYEDAVGARDGGAAALGAGSDADDADRAAGQPDEGVHVARVDAEQTEDGARHGRGSLE